MGNTMSAYAQAFAGLQLGAKREGSEAPYPVYITAVCGPKNFSPLK